MGLLSNIIKNVVNSVVGGKTSSGSGGTKTSGSSGTTGTTGSSAAAANGYYNPNKDYSAAILNAQKSGASQQVISQLQQERQNKIDAQYGGVDPYKGSEDIMGTGGGGTVSSGSYGSSGSSQYASGWTPGAGYDTLRGSSVVGERTGDSDMDGAEGTGRQAVRDPYDITPRLDEGLEGPIKTGRVTTIYHPYQGKVPVQGQKKQRPRPCGQRQRTGGGGADRGGTEFCGKLTGEGLQGGAEKYI